MDALGFTDVTAFADAGAARDRRVVLHPPPLRAAAARRDRAVRALRLFRHLVEDIQEGLGKLRDWVEAA
jgi:hypothetical protein